MYINNKQKCEDMKEEMKCIELKIQTQHKIQSEIQIDIQAKK